jgi:hypothetical protein
LTVGADIVDDAMTHTRKVVSDVLWITPQGDIEALPPLTESQLPPFVDDSLQRTKNFRLIPAADGSPWFWTGKSWFRFDPWLKSFIAPVPAPLDGPDDDMPIVAVDPGLMVWLQREPGPDAGEMVTKVRGFRYDVRGPMARDTKFVLTDHDPQHIVPDRPLGGDIQIEDNVGLHLTKGAVGIADTTYGDVVVSGKTRSMNLPGIRLGSTFLVGSEQCPWPSSSGTEAGVGTDRSFEVKRSGAGLVLTADPGTPASATLACTGPEGRVSVALSTLESSPVTVFELSVTRVAPP